MFMQPVRLPPSAKRVQDNRLWAAFDYAFSGILYATRTQRNMRIHLVAASLAIVATLYLRLDRAYVALVVLCIALVIALELVNTAIEAVVDLMTVAHHPLAKIAKDAAAGAVLVVSMASVIVGYLAFYEGVTASSSRPFPASTARHCRAAPFPGMPRSLLRVPRSSRSSQGPSSSRSSRSFSRFS